MKRENNFESWEIRITGLVQGVGFRPFVYRIATALGLKGTVDNRNDGVLIRINADKDLLNRFVEELKRQAPEASSIERITVNRSNFVSFGDFRIVKSNNNRIVDEITEVSPDIAVCDACLRDMKTQPHRINYPFINCTNCGPRFTIIRKLPYDRPNTTMAPFKMCPQCASEYTDVSDRRFHAQPVACNRCGPRYTLKTKRGNIDEIEVLTAFLAEEIEAGKTVALKGLGGFNLLCDAANEQAVRHLRKSKYRDGKPMAVMFRNLNRLKEYAYVSEAEEELLTSWRRPIVLLNSKKLLAPGVYNGFSTVGALLPYMPFHYLLFEKCSCDAIVFTSANIAGEPIIIDNAAAERAFGSKVGAVVTYNREIHNRTDDSVAFVVNRIPRLVRRSRGYAPSPVRLGFDVDGILATGAELVNTFCIGRTSQAILSQHIGDLKNAETLEFFEESISRYKELFKFTPELIACDMHPDYLSTRYAESQHVPRIAVQHHHAHMAACMAENGLDEPVIGIIFDGTGLGTDGHIWGGEFLTGDFKSFERRMHFDYIPLPGGDRVTGEPWRTAVAYLWKTFGDGFGQTGIPFVGNLDKAKVDIIVQMLEKNINTPLSSSAGRLFDAVSALQGLCSEARFHAEAPMRLEDAIGNVQTRKSYSFDIEGDTIVFTPMFREMVDDIAAKTETGVMAAKFHNTVINLSVTVCQKIKNDTGLKKVVLSGGTFQNRYLSRNLENMLKKSGFQVFIHTKVPANDGGIALGQLAVAAKQKSVKR